MIGSIRGKLLGFEGLTALVEASSGVGYEVEIPANLLTAYTVGTECFFFIHHVVREDAELLYGFNSKESRLLFREIIKINGVGPRVAMALLSTFDLPSFIEVINQNRINALVAAPGVGKKTAERIIVEMKDRIDKLRLGEMLIANGTSTELAAGAVNAKALEEATPKPSENGAFNCEQAVMALQSLGYKENQALATVKSVFEPGMNTEEIIVKALAALSKR